ncbi:rhomboid family protein [Hymenobacter rigui]|uniref:Rhomboid family intramembrane serine protease n=1 Tax=Hymenobacter rigui TaxID=334424 RepID=A0A3R9V0C4_9BACT|nr:rhomboid family intramembrane serine protease [Hymenobacter rigui]RSK44018.1 rhomboid family intramembrane serine protease [Hymenobacter rigui]
MNDLGIVGLGLVLLTCFVSYQGLNDPAYFARHAFEVGPIRYRRQYQRLLSSGFLHVSWWHLGFNMLTLWCFGGALEALVGMQNFLTLYFTSLIGGNLFSLWLHRHEARYSAVGASGAVSGLIFASIALFPGIEVGMLGIYLPGWLYGLLFVLLSAYGITVRRDSIGHDAHLGGALVGLTTMLVIQPELLRTNYLTVLAIVVPAVGFLYLLLRRPAGRLRGNLFNVEPGYQTLDDRDRAKKQREEAYLNELLDKINQQGLEGLSRREKKTLDDWSR